MHKIYRKIQRQRNTRILVYRSPVRVAQRTAPSRITDTKRRVDFSFGIGVSVARETRNMLLQRAQTYQQVKIARMHGKNQALFKGEEKREKK